MKTVKLTAPSAWAPYLINCDCRGLGTADRDACDYWITRVGLGAPVDLVSTRRVDGRKWRDRQI